MEFSQKNVSFLGPLAEFQSQGIAETAGARGEGLPFLLGSGPLASRDMGHPGHGRPSPGSQGAGECFAQREEE